MYEKANVIDWIFAEIKKQSIQTDGVWFMDADITFLAPLPSLPEYADLALCPHYIKERDTKRFGYYNAGFLWMRNPNYLADWRKAGHGSRYFEQSALEDIAASAKQSGRLYEFPIQVNFGWWRMFQGNDPASLIQSRFSLFRNEPSIGLHYDGVTLQSVHTHWNDHGEPALQEFNKWIREFLTKFKKHTPISTFLRTIHNA
jgi:hypothetical protein